MGGQFNYGLEVRLDMRFARQYNYVSRVQYFYREYFRWGIYTRIVLQINKCATILVRKKAHRKSAPACLWSPMAQIYYMFHPNLDVLTDSMSVYQNSKKLFYL